MKKKLFLLPLLAGLMLCGCDPNAGGNGGFDYDGGDDFVAKTNLFNDGDEGKLSIRFSNLLAATGGSKTGYQAVAAVTSLGGYTVAFNGGVCLNRLNSESFPTWTTPNDNYANVVQFSAQNGGTNKTNPAGEVTVQNIKATKVTIYALTSYSYDTGDWWVTFDGATIAAPSTAETEQLEGYFNVDKGGKNHQGYLEKVVFNVNATSAGILKFGSPKIEGKGTRLARKIVIE